MTEDEWISAEDTAAYRRAKAEAEACVHKGVRWDPAGTDPVADLKAWAQAVASGLIGSTKDWWAQPGRGGGGRVIEQCLQELCRNWSGDGRVCPCAVLDLEPLPVEEAEGE